MRSSSVGMVQADTLLPDREMHGPPALLLASSNSMPSQADLQAYIEAPSISVATVTAEAIDAEAAN